LKIAGFLGTLPDPNFAAFAAHRADSLYVASTAGLPVELAACPQDKVTAGMRVT